MQSILLVFLKLSGILLFAILNQIFISMLYKKGLSFKTKLFSIIGLVIVNVIIIFFMYSDMGKIMFLLPVIVLGPSYPLIFDRKRNNKKDC
ncbi:hypothetical protein COJ15_30240 [Bacillus thuringiensis]|uniref:Uncharacterized protein n=1 Tax=Bacillus thuringiensis TaxID=1428 RepID=A0A9X6ZQK5_BACTU|nr:hypothetical protein COJ15_30240 [Bacillus thuringiensis]PGP12819.1 hypothetical protein COA01_33935 [Bacillus cereus]